MQHLLLALSIITLLLIADNGRGKTPVANSKVTIKVEKLVMINAKSDFFPDETSVSLSRFDMFVY